MTLFELNEQMAAVLEQIVDPETGEINEEAYAAMEALDLDRSEKIDSWCFYLKEQKAELKAMKELLDEARARYTAAQNAYDRKFERFRQLMDGEKFKSPYNSVSYRTTPSVVLDDGVQITDIDDDYLRYKDPELNKEKIKEALKAGTEIRGVHLEENVSMTIR